MNYEKRFITLIQRALVMEDILLGTYTLYKQKVLLKGNYEH